MNLLPLTLLLAVHAEPLKPGDHSRSVESGDKTRTYLVHVPKNYDAKKPTPVVLSYHGALTNGAIQKFFCGLDKKADEAGFIVVYPDGTGNNKTLLTWNAGGVRGWNPVDDVAFTAKLLDDLATVANVDTKRVYATGMSNGAMMSYRVAAELSDRIAAIAPVAGTLAIDKPQPKRPVPVMHFHGTADTLVRYEAPKQRVGFLTLKGVEESAEIWVKLNGCKEKPESTEVADGKKDGLKVTKKAWTGGKNGAEVILYTIDGGGHTWPGRPAFVDFLGKSAQSISANDLMWEFFQKHPMK